MNPEDCGHETRSGGRIDRDGLPERLYWEADCQDCGAVVSLVYEPTGEAVVQDVETGDITEIVNYNG